MNESQVSRRCSHFKDMHIDRVPLQLLWGVGRQCREQSSELGAPSLLFFLHICSPYLFQGLKCMESALQKQIINCYFLLLLQRLCISGAQKEELLLRERVYVARAHHTYLKSRLPKKFSCRTVLSTLSALFQLLIATPKPFRLRGISNNHLTLLRVTYSIAPQYLGPLQGRLKWLGLGSPEDSFSHAWHLS